MATFAASASAAFGRQVAAGALDAAVEYLKAHESGEDSSRVHQSQARRSAFIERADMISSLP